MVRLVGGHDHLGRPLGAAVLLLSRRTRRRGFVPAVVYQHKLYRRHPALRWAVRALEDASSSELCVCVFVPMMCSTPREKKKPSMVHARYTWKPLVEVKSGIEAALYACRALSVHGVLCSGCPEESRAQG